MADEIIRKCDDLDECLAPFVDREDPPAARRAVAQHLDACPPCRAHAADEAATRELVHAHRDSLRVTAPDTLRARCAQSTSTVNIDSASGSRRSALIRRWAPLSLAATLVLAVAGVFVLGLNNPVEALAATLTLDHVKCFKVGEVHPDTNPVVAARDWEQAQGWPIVVPNALPAEQLTLVDVRRCYSSDGKAAHLLYSWRGAPLSLYVMPEDAGHAGTVKKMGRDAVIWCAKGRTYAVVADADTPGLARIVDYMKANAR
jgi:anti-sigma factor RsiW